MINSPQQYQPTAEEQAEMDLFGGDVQLCDTHGSDAKSEAGKVLAVINSPLDLSTSHLKQALDAVFLEDDEPKLLFLNIGIITSQVRAIMIASSSAGFCQVSLNKLQVKLESLGYPTGIIQQTMSKTYEALLPLLPIPFSSSRSTGLQPAPLV